MNDRTFDVRILIQLLGECALLRLSLLMRWLGGVKVDFSRFFRVVLLVVGDRTARTPRLARSFSIAIRRQDSVVVDRRWRRLLIRLSSFNVESLGTALRMRHIRPYKTSDSKCQGLEVQKLRRGGMVITVRSTTGATAASSRVSLWSTSA